MLPTLVGSIENTQSVGIFKICAQILREINFDDLRGSKSAILAALEVMNFDFIRFLQFSKVEIYQI